MIRSRRIPPLKSLDDTGVPDSHMKILAIIRRIPLGRVCTYGRIAKLAGLPGRARLVGRILRDSPLAGGVPWHRVVNASGGISLRAGDSPSIQNKLLENEGVAFKRTHFVNLTQHLWNGRESKKRRREQRESHSPPSVRPCSNSLS